MPAQRVLYDPGIHVEPSGAPGNDYANIHASPEQFGAIGAQGLQNAGRGLQQASQAGFQAAAFFGQVAADDATNNYQDFATKLLYGDPTKTTIGPDGKPQTDVGYFGLKGADALRARPDIEKSLDDKMKDIGSTLGSPEQKLMFDNFTRRYRMLMSERIGAHADREANTYAAGVNTSSEKLALNNIAINADDPDQVSHLTDSLVNARVKNVQLAGGSPEQIQEAQESGRKLALKAQLDAIAVKDPARAMKMLDASKTTAGDLYDNMAREYRSRAEQQTGTEAGMKAFRNTYGPVPGNAQVVPVLNNIGAKYGVSGSYLERTWQIESGGRFNPANSSTGAQGPFQFTGSTAKSVGLTNPQDFQASAEAAAKLAANNKALLSSSLGRAPTDAELYLAHQQGAQGASLLLTHPNERAGDLLPPRLVNGKWVDPIAVNGGDPNAPASQFTAMWTAKFNGSAAVMSGSRKSMAYQEIAGNPYLNENERAHAFQYVNRIATAQQIAMESDAAGRKLANEQAANEYVTQMLTGKPFDMNTMANDSRLDHTTKENLYQFAAVKLGVEDPIQYGSKYTDAYSRMFLPADNPSKITDINQILQMGLPGGGLTPRGVDRLTKLFTESRNARLGENDINAVNTSKAALLKYAQSVMGREQIIPGIGAMSTNKKGMEVFNSTFVPRFEAEYAKWTKDPKNNPYEFLTRENIDKLMDQVYPKAQRNADSISGINEVGGQSTEMPAPPNGVSTDGWKDVLTHPPVTAQGSPMPVKDWSAAVNMLLSDPSPEGQKQFNASKFGKAGFRAEELLKKLRPNG